DWVFSNGGFNVAKQHEITGQDNVNSATGKPYTQTIHGGLLNLASVMCAKAQNKASGSQWDRYHGRMRKYQNTREYSYDSSLRRDSSPSIDDSEYTKSVATSVENLSMDVANSSAASSSENSSVSNVSVEPIVLAKSIDNTRALLKKKSLVQVINNYIKAGIEEGKRQAKKYIRKALSFGVKSGYLIPTDPQGQMIRVSPTLIKSRSDVESRKRRKRARRGEEDPAPDNREHHQPTPPWNSERKRITRREDTPRPETPPRKRRRTTKNSRKSSRKRGPMERVPRNGKKRNARKRKKDKLMISMLSNVPANKSDENVLKKTRRTRSSHKCDVDEKKEGRRDRRAKSPRARKQDNENSMKNNEDSSNEDADSAKFSDSEVNDRTPIRRRKSTTSREDASRNGDPSLGDP
ncbi:unnamed protein product, partial [Heterotrigona itama]